MKLNLGCGPRIIKGFINVDIRNDLQLDVVDDIRTLKTFKNESADLIYSCHGIEHFFKDERLTVLSRWHQVLKKGGTLRLALPDFEMVAKCYLDGSVPFEKLWSSLNGSQRHPYDFHYHCYDFKHLTKDLEEVGFANVRRYDWRKTEHADYDDYSQAYWPHMDKANGILLSLNVEATKP